MVDIARIRSVKIFLATTNKAAEFRSWRFQEGVIELTGVIELPVHEGVYENSV